MGIFRGECCRSLRLQKTDVALAAVGAPGRVARGGVSKYRPVTHATEHPPDTDGFGDFSTLPRESGLLLPFEFRVDFAFIQAAIPGGRFHRIHPTQAHVEVPLKDSATEVLSA